MWFVGCPHRPQHAARSPPPPARNKQEAIGRTDCRRHDFRKLRSRKSQPTAAAKSSQEIWSQSCPGKGALSRDWACRRQPLTVSVDNDPSYQQIRRTPMSSSGERTARQVIEHQRGEQNESRVAVRLEQSQA